MKYEIVTHDGKTYEIQQDDPQVVKLLARDLELIPVTLSSGKIEYFAKGNVARIQSRHAASKLTQLEATAEIDNRDTVGSERLAELKKRAFSRDK